MSHRRPRAESARSRPARRAGALWLVPAAIVLAGLLLRLSVLDVPSRTPDETFYGRYGYQVAHQGLSFIPFVVYQANRRPAWHVLPCGPQRVGYILLLAGSYAVSGANTVNLVAAVSLLSSSLVLLLLVLLGRRLADAWTTSAAALLLAFSPMDLAIARRGWQDDVLALFVLCMLYACVRAAIEPPRRRWIALFFGAGLIAILIKESAWPVYVAGTLFLAARVRAVRAAAGGDPLPPPSLVLLVGALGAGAALAVVAMACGSLAELRLTLHLAATNSAPNEYMRLNQMGSPLYYVEGLARLVPTAFVLGSAGTALGIFRAHRLAGDRPAAGTGIAVMAWFVAGFAVLAAIYPQRNLRFLSPLQAPCALLGALALREGVRAVLARLPESRRWWVPAGVALLLAGSAALDVARFREFFIRRGAPDLVTPAFRPPPRDTRPG